MREDDDKYELKKALAELDETRKQMDQALDELSECLSQGLRPLDEALAKYAGLCRHDEFLETTIKKIKEGSKEL